MSRDKTSVSPNISFTFTKFLTTAVILGLVFTGYNNNADLAKVVEHKDEIIAEQTLKYNSLLSEHQKSQALIQATTEEVKRLSNELKEYKNISNQELIFTEETTTLGLDIVSDHIKENEAFSSIAYQDSDGKYHNGYGTVAKLVTYKVGDTVKVKNAKGKTIVLIAEKGNQKLPERTITKEEALSRKEAHLINEVFPYLYGKRFRSQEEFIVATDVIYNRGIGNSKSLFNSDGTINCKGLYKYMTHSKKNYQKAMQKRYAKNYALCIQS